MLQVFPDEFHVHTLPAVLDTCAELSLDVDLRAVLGGVLARVLACPGARPLGDAEVFDRVRACAPSARSAEEDGQRNEARRQHPNATGSYPSYSVRQKCPKTP